MWKREEYVVCKFFIENAICAAAFQIEQTKELQCRFQELLQTICTTIGVECTLAQFNTARFELRRSASTSMNAGGGGILVETVRSLVRECPWWHIVFQSISCKVAACFSSFVIYFQQAFLIWTPPIINPSWRAGGMSTLQGCNDVGTTHSRGCENQFDYKADQILRFSATSRRLCTQYLLFSYRTAACNFPLFHTHDFTY